MNEAYAQFVKSRAKKLTTLNNDLIHVAIGIAGEAGEVIDIAKKSWVYDKPFDAAAEEHMLEELGDILFYVQHACNLLDSSFGDLIARNIGKLEIRYPTGYTDKAAQDRADKPPGE